MSSPFIVVSDSSSVLEGKLVHEVMEKLLAGEHPTLKYLKAQYEQSRISSIEYSGVGIFANFEIAPTAVVDSRVGRVVLNANFGARMMDESCSLGFMLFVSDGKVDFLEGVVDIGDCWPSLLQGYSLVIPETKLSQPIPPLTSA